MQIINLQQQEWVEEKEKKIEKIEKMQKEKNKSEFPILQCCLDSSMNSFVQYLVFGWVQTFNKNVLGIIL
jgi:hypothetical protein